MRLRSALVEGGGSRKGALALLMMASTAIGLVAPPAARPALAQQAQQITFAIPAGTLSSTLTAFGRQAGLQVTYVPAVVAGKRSAGVTGAMTANAALARLLQGSGLTHRFAGATTVTVQAAGSAAVAGAAPEGAIALDTIDVTGARGAAADDPYRTPGSSAHISAEQIQRVAPISAGDIFRDTPGVMSGSNHNGTAIDVNIRGVQGMNRVKVMVEGTQQDVSLYRGYAGPDNRSYIDPDFISGVAIDKGPASGPYGSGTTGGTVNMQTLNVDDILLPGRNFGSRFRFGIGSNMVAPDLRVPTTISMGTGVNLRKVGSDWPAFSNASGSLAAAYRAENWEILGAYSRRIQGNYFAGSNGPTAVTQRYVDPGSSTIRQITTDYSTYVKRGEEVPNTSEDTISALLKAKGRWGDGHSLELGYLLYDSQAGVVFPSSVGMRQQQLLSTIISQRFNARYRWAPDNDLINLTANVWGTTLRAKDPNEHYFNTSNGMGWRSLVNTTAWGGEIWNSSIFHTAAGKLTATYGAEYASTATRTDSYRNPNINTRLVGYPDVPLTRGFRNVGGTYLKATLEPLPWLRLDAGLRFDAYRTTGVSSLVGAYDRVTRTYPLVFTANDLSSSALSPNLGVTIIPVEGVQVFAKYGQGWRPPSMVETYGAGAASYIRANPNLRPERSRSWEFGVNVLRNNLFTERDALRLKAAYFNNHYTDYIAREIVSYTDFYFTNIPAAKMSGIEMTASYDMRVVFGQIGFTYFDNVKYCFTDTFQGTGINGCVTQAPTANWMGGFVQPKYSGSITLGTRLLDERLEMGVNAQFFGASAVDVTIGAGFLYAPVLWRPQTIVNLFGSYKFSDHLSVNLSVENLFDRYYISPLAVATIPSPGRTARLTVTGRF